MIRRTTSFSGLLFLLAPQALTQLLEATLADLQIVKLALFDCTNERSGVSRGIQDS
jgi:hypothetical protein